MYLMSTFSRINEDLTQALKNKRDTELGTLRLIKAALLNKEKEAREELTQDTVQQVLRSLAKKHHDSIDAYERGGRPDLVAIEREQLGILEKYLEKQFTEDEVRAKVAQIIETIVQEGQNNFGAVMGRVMSELKGKADGGLVNKVVKEILNG